jgi:mRNA-degrading endonuclease toxin of MazEF toxin-antitoxin module
VTVAEVTTTIRGLDAEVSLDEHDGMPEACVVNLDSLTTVKRNVLLSYITTLGAPRMAEVERAIHLALAIPLPCLVD